MKEYRIFIIKVVSFITILIAIDYSFGFIMSQANQHSVDRNPEHYWIKTSYIIEKGNWSSIILGSSDAMVALIPTEIEKEIGIKTFNCGMDGCHFLYQNAILNTLLDNYKPELVMWGLDPLDFIDSVDTGEYYRAKNLSPYYHKGYKWIDEYINSEGKKVQCQKVSNMFCYNSKVLNFIIPGFTKGPQNILGYAPMPSEGYITPSIGKEDNTINNKGNKEKLKKLAEVLRRCKQLNVNIVIIVLPKLTHKSIAYNGSVIRLSDMAKEYGFPMINYSSHKVFMSHPEFFKDNDHLNSNGAELFTKMLSDSIKYLQQ